MSLPSFEPFLASESWLHERDPRAKLAAALILLLAVISTPDSAWWLFALWLGVLLLLEALGRFPIRPILRRSLLAIPFVLGALLLPFTVAGTTVARVPILGWPLSDAGLVRAVSLILRAWVSILLLIMLAACTRIRDLLWSLESFKVPGVLVAVIEFALRYLALSVEEAAVMLRARRARMVDPRGRGVPPRQQVMSAGGMVGTLILRGLDRGDRVHSAMIARGYDGTIRRMRRFELEAEDLLLPLAGIVILLVIFFT